MITIYALHQGDHDYKYVGATKLDLKTRLRNHRKSAKFYDTSHVQKWINEDPQNVQIYELEIVDETDAKLAEAKWIATLGTYENGVNSSPIGRGGLSGYKVPDSLRELIRSNSKKQVWSDESRKRIGDIHRGKALSSETREKISNGSSASQLRKRRRCLDCDRVSSRQAIAVHQNRTGHSRFEDFEI